jgi:hypothetical protein
MHSSPSVARLKYERELDRLRQQSELLESRGIFVRASSRFPFIRVVLTARSPVSMVGNVRQGIGSIPQQFVFELPYLSARAIEARFDLTDYNLRAPSLIFTDPWTGSILSYDSMFRALEYEKSRGAHVVLLGDHPVTHKPFLCMRGIREYHEHPQHTGDDWLLYKDDLSIFTIVMSVWRVTIDLIHPQIRPAPGGIQVTWLAEEKL